MCIVFLSLSHIQQVADNSYPRERRGEELHEKVFDFLSSVAPNPTIRKVDEAAIAGDGTVGEVNRDVEMVCCSKYR